MCGVQSCQGQALCGSSQGYHRSIGVAIGGEQEGEQFQFSFSCSRNCQGYKTLTILLHQNHFKTEPNEKNKNKYTIFVASLCHHSSLPTTDPLQFFPISKHSVKSVPGVTVFHFKQRETTTSSGYSTSSSDKDNTLFLPFIHNHDCIISDSLPSD